MKFYLYDIVDVLPDQVIRENVESIYSMGVFHLTSPIEVTYIHTYLTIFQKGCITVSEITTSKLPMFFP